MHLVKEEVVRTGLGYGDVKDVVNAVNSELDMAEASISGSLRTTFNQEAMTDYFYVASSRALSDTQKSTTLFLNKGFVIASPAYTIVSATSMAGLTESSAVNMRLVDAVDLTLLDLQKGLLHINGYDLTGRYVKVTYTAGFAVDDDTATLYDQTEVPDWLKQMATLYTKIGLGSNPSLHSEPEKGDSATPLEFLKTSYNNLMAANVRYAPLAVKPMM